MGIHLFGIRHHGPGCARSLLAALEALAPDALLVEGPPDGEAILPFAAGDELVPPVAMLIYPAEEPQRGVFYPFAVFSPEWQAIRFALARRLPLRFMDLALKHRLPLEKVRTEVLVKAAEAKQDEPPPNEATSGQRQGGESETSTTPTLDDDPLGLLAVAAGYSDHELWWEHQIEQRIDPTGLFEGIAEAMTVLRASQESLPGRVPRPFEAEREAAMRQTIRSAKREGFQRIAVVCGAWHGPALSERQDTAERQLAKAELLKNLPKEKVEATWTPWTYSRLSYHSGYGAGVRSPGWYEHLWNEPRSAPLRWIATAARLIRDEDLDASSASVIDAVRLSEALAAMRELPLVGLAELNEAMLAALCGGNPTPLALVRDKLEIGSRLGQIPADAPMVPLARDLEAQQKSLRLKTTTEIKTLDLDLRNQNDRACSRLLHRLALLDIPWGEVGEARGKAGTFHELWKLQWQVEFVVRVIERSVWGGTVERAATTFASDLADRIDELPKLTELLTSAMLADLPAAVERILRRLQTVAAVSADVRHLADALPPLARVARYSDVRKTEAEQLQPVITGFFERIVVGLPLACRSIDEDAAATIAESIDHVGQSLNLLQQDELVAPWRELLAALLADDAVHPLVRGLACRQLLEAGDLDDAQLHRRARLELSPAVQPHNATLWLQGVLRGSGLLLIHREALWLALDRWLTELGDELFAEMLPLVRRAFADFSSPERRTMGEKVKHLKPSDGGPTGSRPAAEGPPIDAERAARVLPVLARILGVES